MPNPHLDCLIDQSFQFENITDRTVHPKYYLPAVDIKDYKVMIDGQNICNQLAKII